MDYYIFWDFTHWGPMPFEVLYPSGLFAHISYPNYVILIKVSSILKKWESKKVLFWLLFYSVSRSRYLTHLFCLKKPFVNLFDTSIFWLLRSWSFRNSSSSFLSLFYAIHSVPRTRSKAHLFTSTKRQLSGYWNPKQISFWHI